MNENINQTQKLEMALMTVRWLKAMGKIAAEMGTGDLELDAEIQRYLSIAEGQLLHWRLAAGQEAGLIEIQLEDT